MRPCLVWHDWTSLGKTVVTSEVTEVSQDNDGRVRKGCTPYAAEVSPMKIVLRVPSMFERDMEGSKERYNLAWIDRSGPSNLSSHDACQQA